MSVQIILPRRDPTLRTFFVLYDLVFRELEKIMCLLLLSAPSTTKRLNWINAHPSVFGVKLIKMCYY